MEKEKEINLLNVENTQDNKDVSPTITEGNEKGNTDKQKDKSIDNKDTKETENTQNEYKSLETYKNSLNPQEKKILEKFMSSPVFDSFMSYLETFFREKDTLIHRINCYCFRAKENFNIRIYGKIYEIKKNEVIYIQKDSFGNSLLRNDKLERIL